MNFLLGKLWRLAYVCALAFLSSHAFETWPCLSMQCCCQARGQDEDEMAPPQKIPQSCFSLCRSCWRGRTSWSGVHETSPLPALPNMVVLAVFAIPVSDVVLFLGGVLRCRAPWFDGTNEGPCLSDVTGSQQQCCSPSSIPICCTCPQLSSLSGRCVSRICCVYCPLDVLKATIRSLLS